MHALRRLATLDFPLVAVSMCHAPHPAPEDDDPKAQGSTVRAIADLFPTVELVGFGYHGIVRGVGCDYTPTTWYRVRRDRAEGGGADKLVVEAAEAAEITEINEHVENLARLAV